MNKAGERKNSILLKMYFQRSTFLDRTQFYQKTPLIVCPIDINFIFQISIFFCLSLLTHFPVETAIQF